MEKNRNFESSVNSLDGLTGDKGTATSKADRNLCIDVLMGLEMI